MKIAIMQPYFFPYIGYFQLLNLVDKFVIYDNVEYTKKGWINRNRFLQNGKDEYFTIPIKKDSDYALIGDRILADSSQDEILKILRKIKEAYGKAPYFGHAYPVLESIFLYSEKDLFKYLKFSLEKIMTYLEIKTDIIVSSELEINHSLSSQKKVLAICNKLEARDYINLQGGSSLYSKDIFSERNISLSFIKADHIKYNQFENEFLASLSIIDVMMFNSKESIQNYLNRFSLS